MSEEEKKGGAVKPFIVVLTVIIGIFIVLFLFNLLAKDSMEGGKLTYRDATTADIDGDWNGGLWTEEFIFVPRCDIANLSFAFNILDKNGKVIKTIIKDVGNVEKGQQYKVSINGTDLGDLSTMWNSRSVQLEINSGRVSVF